MFFKWKWLRKYSQSFRVFVYNPCCTFAHMSFNSSQDTFGLNKSGSFFIFDCFSFSSFLLMIILFHPPRTGSVDVFRFYSFVFTRLTTVYSPCARIVHYRPRLTFRLVRIRPYRILSVDIISYVRYRVVFELEIARERNDRTQEK